MALNAGLLTINEARSRMNGNAFIMDSEEEFLALSIGKALLKKNGTMVLPNMSTAISMDMPVQENIKTEDEINGVE